MLAVALVLMLFGIGVALYFRNVYLGLIPVFLAAIPAGMALGTQKKDFWC